MQTQRALTHPKPSRHKSVKLS